MAGDDFSAGLASAVAATADGADAPASPALQLPLLPADQVDQLPLDRTQRQAVLQAPRNGPGRPAGAPNKRTTDWARYLLSKYRSPLEMLAETYSRPVADLAGELGCNKLDAYGLQVKAAAELAPYLHGKMPVEIAVRGDLPTLNLVDPRLFVMMAGGGVDGQVMDLSAVEVIPGSKQNQEVSLIDQATVGQPQLDSEPKAQADQAVAASEPLIADQRDGGE